MSASAISQSQVESNKATVKLMLERLSEGDVAGFTDHLLPDYIRHSQAMPQERQDLHGKEAMHQYLLANFTTFPNYTEELEWLVGDGDSWPGVRVARALNQALWDHFQLPEIRWTW